MHEITAPCHGYPHYWSQLKPQSSSFVPQPTLLTSFSSTLLPLLFKRPLFSFWICSLIHTDRCSLHSFTVSLYWVWFIIFRLHSIPTSKFSPFCFFLFQVPFFFFLTCHFVLVLWNPSQRWEDPLRARWSHVTGCQLPLSNSFSLVFFPFSFSRVAYVGVRWTMLKHDLCVGFVVL